MTHPVTPTCSALELPDLSASDRLRSVLSAALADAGARTLTPATTEPLWQEDYFGLEACRQYQRMSGEDRRKLQHYASQQLVEEAWYIEKCGMAYASKMSLLSTSTQERMMYSLFAADEARHFHGISQWMSQTEPPRPSAFHHFLQQVIEREDRECLVFVVQVVLEGWGLRHYKDLASHCTSGPLTALFQAILADEAKHHGSGAMMFSSRSLSRHAQERLIEMMSRFLAMVQPGPVGVLSAFEAVCGPLDRTTKLEIMKDLGAEHHAEQRLRLLRELMRAEQAKPIVSALTARGAFDPTPPEAWL